MKFFNAFLPRLAFAFLLFSAGAVAQTPSSVNHLTVTPTSVGEGGSVSMTASLSYTGMWTSGTAIFEIAQPSGSTTAIGVPLPSTMPSTVSASFTPTAAGSYTVRAMLSGVYMPPGSPYPFGLPSGYSQTAVFALDVPQDTDGDGLTDAWESANGGGAGVYNQVTSSLGNAVPAGWPYLAAGDASQTAEVGSTSGELSVGPSGDVSYTVPLWTTPGTSGMTPELALAYSSQGGSGLAGHGWSISGLSSVTRGPRTLAVDGVRGSVSYKSADADLDRFYLDGQRLLPVDGNNREFRTEIDSYSRVTSVGGSPGNPASFKVQTKSGLTMLYGTGTGAATTLGEVNATWHLSKVVDSAGNYMSYAYASGTYSSSTSPANGGRYHQLNRIDYGGNEKAGTAHYASVRFEYVVRTSVSSSVAVPYGYVKGVLFASPNLLDSVKIHYNPSGQDVLLRRYKLGYATSALPNPTPYLSTVTETGQDGKSLKPLTFGYTGMSQSGIDSTSSFAAPEIPFNRGDKGNGVGFMDVNGDGRPDFVYSRQLFRTVSYSCYDPRTGRPSTCYRYEFYEERKTWLGTASGFVENSGYALPAGLLLADHEGKDQGLRFVDFNGDGLVDILVGKDSGSSQAYRHTGGAIDPVTHTVWTKDNAWNLPVPIRPSYKPDHAHRHFIDINGDGRPDFVYNNGGTEKGAYLNTGSGWLSASQWTPPLESKFNMHAIFVDVNGDGLPDQLAYQNVNMHQNGVGINTGSGWSWETYSHNPYTGAFTRIAGSPDSAPLDLKRFMPPYPLARYHSGSAPGSSDNTLDIYGVEVADVNGDGLSDLVYADGFLFQNNAPFRTYFGTADGWLQAPASYASPIEIGSKGSNRGGALVDVNGDGLPDIVKYEGASGTGHRVFSYNTGSGFAAAVVGGLPYQLDMNSGESYGNPGSQLIDVNADGLVDQVWNRGNSSGASLAKGVGLNGHQPRGLLTAATNGFGVTVTVAYAALTNPTDSESLPLYKQAPGAPGIDVARVAGPMRVARKVTHEDGFGTTYSILYGYEDLRSDRLRGSLGFRRVATHDTRTGTRSVVEYSQEFPKIGSPVASYTEMIDGSGRRLLADSLSLVEAHAVSTHGKNRYQIRQLSTDETSYDPDSAVRLAANLVYNPLSRPASMPAVLKTSSTDYFGHDVHGNVGQVVVTDTEGVTVSTVSVYDPPIISPEYWVHGRLREATATVSGPGLATTTRRSKFQYYPNGSAANANLLAREIVVPLLASGAPDTVDAAAVGLTTVYEYDAFGSVSKKTVYPGAHEGAIPGAALAQARWSTTERDALGRFPTKSINALGYETNFSYNPWWGALNSQTDPNAQTTSWLYDGFGRLKREQRADGTVTETRRRWAAPPSSSNTAPAGQSFLVESEATGAPPALQFFDKYGRETYAYTLNGGVGGKPRIVGSRVSYDSFGRKATSYQPFYHIVGNREDPASESVFDEFSRVKTVKIRDFSAPDGQWATTHYVYDGLTATTVNPLGQSTLTSTDSLGRVVTVVNNADGASNEKGRLRYKYDGYGQLVEVRVYGDNGIMSDPTHGRDTSFTYDARGRKVAMTDPNMGAWTYAYNAFGELVSQTDAKNQTTTMVYDKLGRMVTRTDAEGATTWTYDTAPRGAGSDKWLGLLHQVEGPQVTQTATSGAVTRKYRQVQSYDNRGRPTTSTRTYDAHKATGSQSYVYAVTQSYDLKGRPSTLTYPGGFKTVNKYADAAGHDFGFLREIAEGGGTLAGANDLSAGQTIWKADDYDTRGALVKATYGNGVVATRGFESETGRLESISVVKGAVSLVGLSYDYDALGNVTRRVDAGVSTAFTYDGLSRIITAGSAAYTYNSFGNITSKTGVTGTFGYDGAKHNQIVSRGGVTYAYDANGNRTSGDGLTLAWTSFNMVSSMSKTTGSITNTARYWYGASRERIAFHDTADSTFTHYVGDLYELEASLSSGEAKVLERWHVYAPSGRVLTRVVTTSPHAAGNSVKLRYLHQDALGSVYAVTDKAGAAVVKYSYDAWGQQTRVTGSALEDDVSTRGYTDHEMLSDYGLIHMNGRLYDPTVSRFLSADPFVDDAKDAQSYNRYSYVNNNPLKYSDPSGYFKLSDVLKIVVAVVVAVVAAAAFAYLAGQAGIGFKFLHFSAALKSAATGALFTSGGLGTAIAAGAGLGFGGSFASSLLNGGSLGAAFKAGVTGAIFGALSAGLAHGIGHGFGETWGKWGQAGAHGVAQGALSEAQGGKFRHGFIAAFATKAAGGRIMSVGDKAGVPGRTAAAALIGGTSSSLGGGKFANGAISGAFTHLFNEEFDVCRTQRSELPSNDKRFVIAEEGFERHARAMVDGDESRYIVVKRGESFAERTKGLSGMYNEIFVVGHANSWGAKLNGVFLYSDDSGWSNIEQIMSADSVMVLMGCNVGKNLNYTTEVSAAIGGRKVYAGVCSVQLSFFSLAEDGGGSSFVSRVSMVPLSNQDYWKVGCAGCEN